jgi:hypothetical protein
MRETRVCRPMDPSRQPAVEGMNARKGHGGNLPIDVQQTAQMLPFCNTAMGRRCPDSGAVPPSKLIRSCGAVKPSIARWPTGRCDDLDRFGQEQADRWPTRKCATPRAYRVRGSSSGALNGANHCSAVPESSR